MVNNKTLGEIIKEDKERKNMNKENKVGRPKIPDENKIKYRRIPVQVETAKRLDEVKVKLIKREHVDNLTYTQMLNLLINDFENKLLEEKIEEIN